MKEVLKCTETPDKILHDFLNQWRWCIPTVAKTDWQELKDWDGMQGSNENIQFQWVGCRLWEAESKDRPKQKEVMRWELGSAWCEAIGMEDGEEPRCFKSAICMKSGISEYACQRQNIKVKEPKYQSHWWRRDMYSWKCSLEKAHTCQRVNNNFHSSGLKQTNNSTKLKKWAFF